MEKKKSKERVYISGPITGLPEDTYIERFKCAEALLRWRGYKPINPTKFLVCRWGWLYRLLGYRLTLLYDLWRLSRCERAYFMPCWDISNGAIIEHEFARRTGIHELPVNHKQEIGDIMLDLIKKQNECVD